MSYQATENEQAEPTITDGIPVLAVLKHPDGEFTVVVETALQDGPVFASPEEWGVLIADLMGHVASEYEAAGADMSEVMNAILDGFKERLEEMTEDEG